MLLKSSHAESSLRVMNTLHQLKILENGLHTIVCIVQMQVPYPNLFAVTVFDLSIIGSGS